MKNVRTLFTIAGLLFCHLFSLSQGFVNLAQQYSMDAQVFNNQYGTGISFVDIDKDGYDDITVGATDILWLYLSGEGEYFSEIPLIMGLEGGIKGISWVDIDNDDDYDLFITQYNNRWHLYRNDGDFVLTEVTVGSGLFENNIYPSYGACWGDYDLDGDLDVYIATYAFSVVPGQQLSFFTNHLFRNNGNMTFTDVTTSSGTSDGLKLSFQGIWTDYNRDGWPDLYICNDKIFPNSYFVNNHNGTFTNNAIALHCDVADLDAMTVTGGDYNNDGWEDFHCTSTLASPNVLLKGIGEQGFEEVAAQTGLDITKYTWGSNWIDYNCDKWQDLYICEAGPFSPNSPNIFMVNQSGVSFADSSQLFPFDTTDAYSCAIGDYDNDGYPDLGVMNINDEKIDFWRNEQSLNNWFKVKLQGVVSNRDGVGSWIDLYSGGDRQSRYTHCGESYLCQNSFTEFFGLAQDSMIDSLVIRWPSGYIDRFYSLAVNQYLIIIEGESFSFTSLPSLVTLCEGESVQLNAGLARRYLWNTGDTSAVLNVNTSGWYQVQIQDSFGLMHLSDSIEVEVIEIPQLEFYASPASCAASNDATLQFNSAQGLYSLNGLPVDYSVDSLFAGQYAISWNYQHTCAIDTAVIIEHLAWRPSMWSISEARCFGEAASVVDQWTLLPDSVRLNGAHYAAVPAIDESGAYQILYYFSNGCTFDTTFEVIIPDAVGMEILVSENAISVLPSGGKPPFDVLWTLPDGSTLIHTPNVPWQVGDFEIIATDSLGCTADTSFQITSIKEAFSSTWQIYPNPASTYVVVDKAKPGLIQLMNACGKIVLEVNSTGLKSRIDLANITPGFYQLRVLHSGAVYSKPLIIVGE